METSERVIRGYAREEGVYGIRNHIIIISSVSCVNNIVQKLAAMSDSAIPVTHPHGCDHIGDDRLQVLRTLSGICNNPNVGGILLVGLGCENVSANEIHRNISTKNKIVRKLGVQEIGDQDTIIKKGTEYIKEIKEFVSKQERVDFKISDLIFGVKCGGSDPFSGITANPAVGVASDKIVELGGTVMLSEIPELIGAEALLASRIKDSEVKEKLYSKTNRYISIAKSLGQDLIGTNPTPGNVRSGISTIEEKSLGAAAKGGTTEVKEVTEYAERPKSRGLVIMDSPGNDIECVTGMSASGAALVLFTTGLGTPVGNPVTPVIKISSNSRIFNNMRSFIDINAGKIREGSTVADVGEEIFNYAVDVCNGEKTLAEKNNQWDFAINRIAPTF